MSKRIVEIIRSPSAGWCWRCWPCDITVAGLDDELEATRQTRAHLASATHRVRSAAIARELEVDGGR